MSKLAEFKMRMQAVSGIGDVCRTLSTVAAAKLSRTHDRALGARAYAATLRNMVARQQSACEAGGVEPATLSPLLQERQVQSVMVLAVGADRGLCGGYNVSLGRYAARVIHDLGANGVDVRVVAKGSRVARYLRRAGSNVVQETCWTRAGVSEHEVEDVLHHITEAFSCGEADEVWACFTQFHSAVLAEPVAVRLLPIERLEAEVASTHTAGWYYEPGPTECVDELLTALVRVQVEAVLLEAFASEQSARMVTMQEASERADKKRAELRVCYNRLRRESITSDLIGVQVAARLRGGGVGVN